MTPAYTLKTTTPADQDDISALLEASYGALMPAYYAPSVLAWALPLITRANPALLASGTYYVVVDGAGQAVGCGGWTMARPGTGEIEPELAHIRHFATHPDWLQQGVGRAIFTHCRDAAAAAGVKRFECYASLNAEGFYRALGLQSIKPLNVAMGPDHDFPSVLMDGAI